MDALWHAIYYASLAGVGILEIKLRVCVRAASIYVYKNMASCKYL